MSRRKSPRPVRAEGVTENFTLRLAHLLRDIHRHPNCIPVDAIIKRALAFNGRTVILRDGKVVDL